jgi:tetratricopeptide (TPR) repeat protein
MIVKNQEAMLGRCLNSIRDWVDEIIVVDTGSTDRTVQIAESFGAKVSHQPWEGDFSKHRNYSIDKATCDWVFIIDADEEVCADDVPVLMRLLADGRQQVISINVINVYGESENRTVFLPSPRFFRRELGLRYEGIVHNQLSLPDDLSITRAGVRLKHFGYDLSPEKLRNKKQRSRRLLEKQLEQDPDNAFALFNYAQLLRSDEGGFPVENAPAIIRSAGRAVELTSPDNLKERHIHLMALDQLAWAHFYLKESQTALQYCLRALRHKSDYLDPLLLLGHIYQQKREYGKAVQAYRDYLEAQASYNPTLETDNIILMHVDSRLSAYYSLGVVARLMNDTEGTKRWLLKVLELDPAFLATNGLLGEVYLQEDNLTEAESHLLKQMEAGLDAGEAALLLGDLYDRQDDHAKAGEYYSKALEMEPKNVSVLTKVAGHLYAQGRDEQGSQLLQRAVGLAEDDPQAKTQIADALQRLGRHAEASEVYQSLVVNGQGGPETYNDLANCYYRLEEFARAEEYYRRALSFESVPVVAYRNQGLTLARLDKPDQAAAMLERYLELQPESQELFSVIGDQYFKLGQFTKAIKYYERHLLKQPGDTAVLYCLSDCYLELGHKDAAILGYQKVLAMDSQCAAARQRLLQLEEPVRNS